MQPMQSMQPSELEVDFFAALKQMQADAAAKCNNINNGNGNGNDTNNNNNNNTDTNCLITHQPLNAFHVRLSCGHKFNYEALFQEVLRQKGRMGMHNFHEQVAMHQIKCPYCRSMTNQLLPYIGTSPHPVIKRLTGVNAPAHLCMPGTPCGAKNCRANALYECNQSLYCYKHYQAALKPGPAASSRCVAELQTGKNKGTQCKRAAGTTSMLCKMHAKCNLVIM
jgi:hypothetical protein